MGITDREKRRRGKKSTHKGLMYNYPSMNKQENIINIWCINNNVRINPVPTKPGGFPEEWRIEVRLGPYTKGEKAHLSPIEVRLGPYTKGEKAHLSPSVYTHENIHQEMRRMQKYHYDKHKK